MWRFKRQRVAVIEVQAEGSASNSYTNRAPGIT